jgi:hypothetical protein
MQGRRENWEKPCFDANQCDIALLLMMLVPDSSTTFQICSVAKPKAQQ